MLQGLSTAECNHLVTNLLGIEQAPAQIRDTIVDGAEGNPFFVEEVIRSLMDDGLEWRPGAELQSVEVPPRIEGVIMTRLDCLPENGRQILQLAAVVGRVFSHRLLAHLIEVDYRLNDHLAELERMELIRVTYILRVGAAEARARAEAIALEQTVEVPRSVVRDGFVEEQILGRVERVEPDGGDGYRAAIAYPAATTALDPAQLVNVMFGNSSLLDGVECADVELPPSVLTAMSPCRSVRKTASPSSRSSTSDEG